MANTAVLYAREGANVAIVYLREEQSDAEETKRAVEKEGRTCLLLPGDVTDASFCRRSVAETVKEFGKLDILVNNAAYQEEQDRPEDVSDEQFDKTFKTNVYGYFYMTKAALEHLGEGAVIVNCGSITGLQGHKNLMDYALRRKARSMLLPNLLPKTWSSARFGSTASRQDPFGLPSFPAPVPRRQPNTARRPR